MLEFETSNGNGYAWDNETGLFIPFSSTMKAVLNEISSKKSISKKTVTQILKKDFDSEEISFCYDWLKKWEKIRPKYDKLQKPQKIDPEELKNYILRNGLGQLILCVTEDCNFRCKFCVYSDNYEYTRTHSEKYMDFSIAKKAIDYYFSLLDKGRRYNPLRKPGIGFYGGEPLLNFEFIKNCVDYAENKYKKYEKKYSVATNGSLLDSEKAKWLIKNSFGISISLNGPKNEHDRLRVYEDGKGTFKDIIKNLDHLMDTEYNDIISLPVFDWKSDLFKWHEFFSRKEIPPVSIVVPVNDGEGSNYYEQFTEEDHLNFLDHIKKAKKYYFENIDQRNPTEKISIFDCLFGMPLGFGMFDTMSLNLPSPIMPFTGACIPGRKIFVDVNGSFHMCERINDRFPIGNVDEGLNFEKISKIIGDYLSQMDKCIECNVSRKCRKCYQHFTIHDKFSCSSKICEGIESNFKDFFIETFEIAETHPEYVDSYKMPKNLKILR